MELIRSERDGGTFTACALCRKCMSADVHDIRLPDPEPPHDHIIVTGPGNVYQWDEEADSWVEVDSQYGMTETWEGITRWNWELTVYAPVKEYHR